MDVISFQKQPNRFLIGATSEFNNYSVGTSEGGLNWLLDHASARVPELKNSRVLKNGQVFVLTRIMKCH